jgi:uncharacterized protein (TIGR00297 family)
LTADVPLDPLSSILVITGLCGALSGLAYYRTVLTADGAIAAFFVGMVIGIFGDVTWLLLLLFFLLSSFLATRYRFALKEAMGVQEGVRGERHASNVLANGIAPMVVAVVSVLNLPGLPKQICGVLFLSALAVAGADTLASEIGVLSREAYLITNLRRVTPGTDGGVSLLGQLSALGASLYTALIGWFVLSYVAASYGFAVTIPMDSVFLLIPAFVGFVGCQVDSVVGATLELQGLVNKKTTNFIATSTGAILSWIILASLYPAKVFG